MAGAAHSRRFHLPTREPDHGDGEVTATMKLRRCSVYKPCAGETDAVATITRNRPQALNALDMAMADGLRHATRHVAGDATVRAVIISGAVAGFGFSLVSACHLAIAADNSYFTLAYRHIGTSPDGGST